MNFTERGIEIQHGVSESVVIDRKNGLIFHIKRQCAAGPFANLLYEIETIERLEVKEEVKKWTSTSTSIG